MNLIQRFGISGAVSLVVLGSIGLGAAFAESYQEQRQEVSGSSSFSYSCTGNGCSGGTSSGETKTEVFQHQYQSVNSDNATYTSRHTYNSNNDRQYDIYAGTRRRNRYLTSGQVDIDWNHEGGVCYVRYTENSVSNYKYSTSTDCDEGGVTIGGLRPGRNYRFQVRQDDGAWSEPVVMRAW